MLCENSNNECWNSSSQHMYFSVTVDYKCIYVSVMPRKTLNVDWKSIDGAAVSKRMLKLTKDEEDKYVCPIEMCLHVGFKSDRGLRKHVNSMHPWYFYFDKQPIINRYEVPIDDKVRRKCSTHNIPAYSLDEGIGLEFLDWLRTPCGEKTNKQSVQIGRQAIPDGFNRGY